AGGGERRGRGGAGAPAARRPAAGSRCGTPRASACGCEAKRGAAPVSVNDNPGILLYTRIRKSPYFYASRRHGVARYSVYNHTYHPRHYGDPVAEYWNLVNGV